MSPSQALLMTAFKGVFMPFYSHERDTSFQMGQLELFPSWETGDSPILLVGGIHWLVTLLSQVSIIIYTLEGYVGPSVNQCLLVVCIISSRISYYCLRMIYILRSLMDKTISLVTFCTRVQGQQGALCHMVLQNEIQKHQWLVLIPS